MTILTGAALALLGFANPTSTETPTDRQMESFPDFNAGDEVLVDTDDAGTVFALGRTWKMKFGRDGATFLPILGARAPRAIGLHFAIPGEAKPAVDGKRVTIDRGSFVETYDLMPDGVEQSFVFAERPYDGDLVVRLPLETELTSLGRDAGGLRFGTGGLGEVTYGDATIVDADGRRISVPSCERSGAIEITVPDAFVDRAVFPLVIDPLLNAVNIDVGATKVRGADIAYSKPLNTFMVAYEREIASNDHDVIVRAYGSLGTSFLLSGEFPIAIDGNDTRNPAVAERNQIVFTVFTSTGAGSRIKGRKVHGFTGALGATFDISDLAANSEDLPDVGASDAAVARPFLVVWQQTVGIVGTEVVGRVTSDSGSLGPTLALAPTTVAEKDPAVNLRAGATGAWLVAYSAVQSLKQDILVTGVSNTGSLLGTLNLSNGSVATEDKPKVGGDGQSFLVTAVVSAGGTDKDLHARALSFNGATFATTTPVVDLGALDHPGETLDQLDCSISFESLRFVVAYEEWNPAASNTDAYVSTVFVGGGTLQLFEGRVPVATTTSPEQDVVIASVESDVDQPGKSLIVWTVYDPVTTDTDLRGRLHTALAGNLSTVVQTGCGTAEPQLVTSGFATPGSQIAVTIFGSVSPMLMTGQPIVPLSFCLGPTGCLLGVSNLSMTPVATSFTVAVPADMGLVGTSVAIQVVDFLPADASGTFCGPPQYTQKFRVTDTHVIAIK